MCKKKLVSQQKHDAIALQNLLGKLGFSRECLQFLFQHRFTAIVSLYRETKISIVQPSVNGLVSNFSRGVPPAPLKEFSPLHSPGLPMGPLKQKLVSRSLVSIIVLLVGGNPKRPEIGSEGLTP